MKKQAKLATFFPSAFCGLDLGTEGGRNMNIERDINITNSRRFPELFELPHLYSSHRCETRVQREITTHRTRNLFDKRNGYLPWVYFSAIPPRGNALTSEQLDFSM